MPVLVRDEYGHVPVLVSDEYGREGKKWKKNCIGEQQGMGRETGGYLDDNKAGRTE